MNGRPYRVRFETWAGRPPASGPTRGWGRGCGAGAEQGWQAWAEQGQEQWGRGKGRLELESPVRYKVESNK